MSLYGRLIYARERKLTLRDTNRRVFPFEWGVKWLGHDVTRSPLQELKDYAARSVANSRQFFDPGPMKDARLENGCLTFSTPQPTPYDFNNRVSCRLFPAEGKGAAVVVVPQWNADPNGHVGLCKVLQKLGMTAARLSMPYHDDRRPPGMERADYMVSPNVGRTLHATRQAVLETIQVAGWLRGQGYQQVAVMGTSIGSCISYLAFIHDPLISCGAFNHVSSYYADVVWRGLSTRYVRWGYGAGDQPGRSARLLGSDQSGTLHSPAQRRSSAPSADYGEVRLELSTRSYRVCGFRSTIGSGWTMIESISPAAITRQPLSPSAGSTAGTSVPTCTGS